MHAYRHTWTTERLGIDMAALAKIAAGLGAGMLVAAMAHASTASNTIITSTAGYGSGAISGATANSIGYTLSADTA